MAGKVIEKIPKKNYPYFWKTLFYEFSMALENSTKRHHLMLRVLAMRFVEKEEVDIIESKYTLATQIKKYCSVCWGIFYIRRTWDKLNDEFQGQMFRFLRDNTKESKKVLYLVVNLMRHHDKLKKEYRDCYYAALEHYSVTDMERYYIDKGKFLKVLYQNVIEPNNFIDQGEFIDMLLSMDKSCLNDYSSEQLMQLGRWVEICCYVGTFKAQNFVLKDILWTHNPDFARGVAWEGLTDDRGNLCFTKRHLQYVLPVLNRTDDLLSVINALNELPVKSTISDATICKGIRCEISKYIGETSEAGMAMKKLVDKYCRA